MSEGDPRRQYQGRLRAVPRPLLAATSGVGQAEKSRQRDGTAALPSTADMFDERRHGR
jgi:hypothetical protein